MYHTFKQRQFFFFSVLSRICMLLLRWNWIILKGATNRSLLPLSHPCCTFILLLLSILLRLIIYLNLIKVFTCSMWVRSSPLFWQGRVGPSKLLLFWNWWLGVLIQRLLLMLVEAIILLLACSVVLALRIWLITNLMLVCICCCGIIVGIIISVLIIYIYCNS